MKTWQLIPHEGFEWGRERSFRANETVQVIYPRHPHYKRKGRVCGVTVSSVEVIEHNTNIKVSLSYHNLLAHIDLIAVVRCATLVFGG